MAEALTPRVEVVHSSQDFGRFHVEPLEPGFGLTLGNALRRVLLSSLPGAAVTSVRVDGIYHEFTNVPGVKEDATELILNLKQLRLKCYSDEPIQLRLQALGPGHVTAADLMAPSEVEIVNPELHIATLDSVEARLEMELTVERGRGYLPSDGREPSVLGAIPVDAVFTPVRRVNYSLENTHVGSRTDLERLILEIQTDETTTPTEALVQAGNILMDHFALIAELQQPSRRGEKPSLVSGAVSPRVFDMPIEALELSARTYNCLKRSQITKVGEILQMSEDELLSLRNFGQKSLQELREKLLQHGIVTEEPEAPGAEGEPEMAEELEEEPEGEGEAEVVYRDEEDRARRR